MKFLVNKVIGGNEYYYLQYKNYSRSLGRSIPMNKPFYLESQLLDFFDYVAENELKKLDKGVKKNFCYGGLDELERLHYWYICFDNELFEHVRNSFYWRFIILFTFNSNRSEGSKVSREEIENFVESRKKKIVTRTDREIANSLAAFEFAVSKDMKWNMKCMREVHRILLKNLDPMIAGKWKIENNTVGGQKTTDYRKVKGEMKQLLEWLNDEFKRKKIYVPELALKFYCRFERIHPFLDGNGRVGRILLNAILRKFKYPPVIFFTENHDSHSEAIKQALEGRYTKLNKHFLEQVKKTRREMVEKMAGTLPDFLI